MLTGFSLQLDVDSTFISAVTTELSDESLRLHDFTGLVPGIAYFARMIAVSEVGASLWTEATVSTARLAPPGRPTTVAVSLLSPTEVSATWRTVDDLPHLIEAYRVQWHEPETPQERVAAAAPPPSGTSATATARTIRVASMRITFPADPR